MRHVQFLFHIVFAFFFPENRSENGFIHDSVGFVEIQSIYQIKSWNVCDVVVNINDDRNSKIQSFIKYFIQKFGTE